MTEAWGEVDSIIKYVGGVGWMWDCPWGDSDYGYVSRAACTKAYLRHTCRGKADR